MTTSITDARFTSLHFTPGHLLSLDFDDPPEDGWSVMPGYDQIIPIPPELEPPRLDADETLPSQLHPSYPFGRPPTMNRPHRPWVAAGNLLGTVASGSGGEGGGNGADARLMSHIWQERWSGGERWEDLGLGDVMETRPQREIAPGMAGAKRPPSPPSPALHAQPPPRSIHLRNLYARQRQATPTGPTDPFDAPVPNETYAEEDVRHQQERDTSGASLVAVAVTAGQPPRRENGDQDMSSGEEDVRA